MALKDFLYRCPLCGADPLQGRGPRAHCASGCGRRLEPTSDREALRVVGPDGSTRIGFVAAGGTLEPGGGPDCPEARAELQITDTEVPVRYRGRLLGFYETFGPARHGRVRLEAEGLVFTPAEHAETAARWRLDGVRALQTASSAVQLHLRDGRLVLFRLPDDSPRRWEALLQDALRRRWQALGRGPIVEFQPRIRTR